MTTFSLEHEQVKQYWQSQSPELASIFLRIEQREEWVMDVTYDDIAKRVVAFGEKLSSKPDPSVLLKAERMDLLVFLVFISTSKAFRMLDYLNQQQQLGDRLVELVLGNELIEKNVDSIALAQALADRFRIAMNASYCRRILDPGRIEKFIDAVREYRQYQEDKE